ncbi:MAG: hypothetical protein JOZ42_06835 [Acetobacteraceae bacterium]|nr:hypothetical protein [Acetobacteraceae bacterium]
MLCALLPLGPAAAQRQPARKPAPAAEPGGPKALGRFESWTAATHEESGQTVCYAFTYATNSTPAIAGRPKAVLTVTERPTGRDAVAISAGFQYPTGAEVTAQLEQSALNFYTSGNSAFARESAVAVAALQKARQIVARSPNPRGGGQIVDTFSLRGFNQAYQAINKACPR